MRGYQSPSLRNTPSELQDEFRGLSRHRRVKLAEVANTTLVKADQWGRGGSVDGAVATALEGAVSAHAAKKKA